MCQVKDVREGEFFVVGDQASRKRRPRSTVYRRVAVYRNEVECNAFCPAEKALYRLPGRLEVQKVVGPTLPSIT